MPAPRSRYFILSQQTRDNLFFICITQRPKTVMNYIEDYVVFVLCLLLPIAVGFFFACRGQRPKTTTEFLFADKNLRSWILALSLVASYFSSVLLLASVAQVFSFGLQYIIFALFAYWFVAAVAHIIFIPMFHRLQVTSVNEVSLWLCNINSELCLAFEKLLGPFSVQSRQTSRGNMHVMR